MERKCLKQHAEDFRPTAVYILYGTTNVERHIVLIIDTFMYRTANERNEWRDKRDAVVIIKLDPQSITQHPKKVIYMNADPIVKAAHSVETIPAEFRTTAVMEVILRTKLTKCVYANDVFASALGSSIIEGTSIVEQRQDPDYSLWRNMESFASVGGLLAYIGTYPNFVCDVIRIIGKVRFGENWL